MNIKTFRNNFDIGENRFVNRHPNSSLIYFLVDMRGEILYVGETIEKRWNIRRNEHIKSGKVFYKMLLCPTGKFKRQTLLIEKGLMLMFNPPLNLERPTWKKKYMDAASAFLKNVEGENKLIQIEKEVEYIDRVIEKTREVEVKVEKIVKVETPPKFYQYNIDCDIILYYKTMFPMIISVIMLIPLFIFGLFTIYNSFEVRVFIYASFFTAFLFRLFFSVIKGAITMAGRTDGFAYYRTSDEMREKGLELYKNYFFKKAGFSDIEKVKTIDRLIFTEKNQSKLKEYKLFHKIHNIDYEGGAFYKKLNK